MTRFDSSAATGPLVALGLIVLMFSPGSLAQSASSTSTSSSSTTTLASIPIHIDRTLFIATVPTYADLGRNYTVKVMVVNDWNQAVPIVLRVDGPVDSVTIHPLVIHALVGAGAKFLANFSLIPVTQHSAVPLTLTAVLAVWYFNTMDRPQVVETVSTVIQSVAPSPYAGAIWAAAAALLVVPMAIGWLALRSRRGRAPA